MIEARAENQTVDLTGDPLPYSPAGHRYDMSTNRKQMPGSEDTSKKIGGRLRRRLGWTIGCPDSGIVCRSREP